MPARKIRVLVVDDSLLFRDFLAKGIAQDPAMEVVATAANAFEARDAIEEHVPDVMALDVEMPRMNGIEFLRRLIPQYPMPVVVVSAVTENVFDALKAGAVDFVSKPEARSSDVLQSFINEIVVKLKIASMAKVGDLKRSGIAQTQKSAIADKTQKRTRSLVAIGASTGGTEAIYDVVKAFDRNGPPIVIVQHMPPIFTTMYAKRLNQSCQMEVREAKDGDIVQSGLVLIAPGDNHMKLVKNGQGYQVKCFTGDKVSGHCPSVDVLFESVAKAAGADAVGVILTGMGRDGATGLLRMREAGAYTIGQDEETSVVYGMPMVAFNIGAVCQQAPLDRIVEWITKGVRAE